MSTSTQSALLAQETFEKEVIGEGQFCQVRDQLKVGPLPHASMILPLG